MEKLSRVIRVKGKGVSHVIRVNVDVSGCTNCVVGVVCMGWVVGSWIFCKCKCSGKIGV